MRYGRDFTRRTEKFKENKWHFSLVEFLFEMHLVKEIQDLPIHAPPALWNISKLTHILLLILRRDKFAF